MTLHSFGSPRSLQFRQPSHCPLRTWLRTPSQDSVGTWRALRILCQKGKLQSDDSRTGEPNTPTTTSPKLTSGGICPSHHLPLSGHLDSSRQHIPKPRRRKRESGAGRRVGGGWPGFNSIPTPCPQGSAIPHLHGLASLWPASGPSHPILLTCCHCCH